MRSRIYLGRDTKEELTVRPDHRMDSRQRVALVEQIAPDALADGVAQPRRLLEEERGVVRRRQPLQQRAHGRREPVVDFVARGPQRVTACRGEGVDLEHRVVGRDRLERYVCVPARGGEARDVCQLVRQAAALLLLLGADDRDLVAELAAFLRQGVDVKVRGLGL